MDGTRVAKLMSPMDNVDVALSLARAFQNESGFSYVIPDENDRARRLAGAFLLLLREEHRKGAVFATPGFEAATLWRKPGQAQDSIWDMVRQAIPLCRQFGFSILRGLEVADYIKKHLPREPVWYLHYAGCDPNFQGKGYGGAAIRAGLDCADFDGLPAYLETADAANLPLYRNFGFETIHDWQIPEGPQFWGMMRPGKTRH